jgi:Type II secretion system (T2SS), protein E, N-terminal domain
MSSFLSPLANDASRALAARAMQPATWLRRLRLRCSASDCLHRDRLWPPFLSQSRGVVLDGRWYCTTECFHDHLMAQVRGLLAGVVRERPRRHRIPLGLLLVTSGVISQQQLREALRQQSRSAGEKLGRVLCEMGFVASDQLTAALANQWGCPVYPLDPQSLLLGCHDLVPFALLQSACAVPVFVSSDGRTLHLAFGERLDHTTLYAVEQMLGCRTIACIAEEASVIKSLEELRRGAATCESSFDTMRDPREIAWTIRSYAGEYRATHIAVARASSYLWVRFRSGSLTRDLLFRIRSEADPARVTLPPAKVFSNSADTQEGGVSDAVEPL